MSEWITKAEAKEMGLTEGQFKWRVVSGDITRHPESKRLYSRYDIERLVKAGRSAQKPFGGKAARTSVPKRECATAPQFDTITCKRAQLALEFCAHAMKKDGELGDLARRLFRTKPEKLIETASAFA